MSRPGDLEKPPEHLPLYGQRTNRAGEVVNDYVAGAALTALHGTGPALPIFEYYTTGFGMGKNLPDRLKASAIIEGAIVEGKTFEYSYNIPLTKPITQLNQLLQADLDGLAKDSPVYNRPLVFLVASGAPHAMIYIISGGKVFSVGFGFHGPSGQEKLPTKLAAAGQAGLAHSVEIINGALYSADYLMPTKNQSAKLAWVGFLTDDIIANIKKDLVQVTNIIYTGTIGSGMGYNVSYNCMLEFGQGYCEAAGFINRGTTNCILWAQSKLNINIDCGFSGNPKNCSPILQDEFADLVQNMNDGPELNNIVTAIQKRLTVGNICTLISRRLGLCGGRSSKRRKNKNKNKNKNKKTHKKTNKKTKKNRRRN